MYRKKQMEENASAFKIGTGLKNLMEKITPSSEEGLIFKEYFEIVFYAKEKLKFFLQGSGRKKIKFQKRNQIKN